MEVKVLIRFCGFEVFCFGFEVLRLYGGLRELIVSSVKPYNPKTSKPKQKTSKPKQKT